MAETHKGFGLLFEMGCGKTLTAIMIAGTAYQMGKVEKVLVVAPTSVCSVWPKDFADFADFKANIKVLLGDKNRRLKLLNDLDNFPFKALKVAVINYESTWREGIFDALYEWNADMIICDESQRIKSHDAEQSKAMHKLGDQAKYKLILSGTPVQNNAIDLYSQYRFLDPTIFGTNFYQFRNRYAIMGGFNRHQIVGYKDLDQLIQKEHSIAYRVTKDEALDLPEQTFLQRYITMSAKEKNIYDRIKRESFAELESGGQISATTVLTKLLRLQQFTGGFLVADGEEKPELVSKGKLNALEEIVDDYVVDAGKKLVIFARFRPEIDRNNQYKYQSLAVGFKDRKVNPFMVQVDPLPGDKKPNKNGHNGQEYDYVIEGQLEVTIEEKVMVLNPGDSIYFDSRKSHCFRSLNNEPAKFLCIII